MRSVLLVVGLALGGCSGKDPVETDTEPTETETPVDADGDGWTDGDDCDDANAEINPDARETCNEGVDDDCDGLVDDDDDDVFNPPRWYRDDDNDDYGNPYDSVETCDKPSNYVADNDDCDDFNEDVNPGMDEVCGDGVDQDCDDQIDEGYWWPDVDGDGFGDASVDAIEQCEQPAGAVDDNHDCDDTLDFVNPDGVEECGNALDEDCDNYVDFCDVADAVASFAADEGEAGYVYDALGTAVVSADVDGDSLADVVLGAPSLYYGTPYFPGYVAAFAGGSTGDFVVSTDTLGRITGDAIPDGFGMALARGGDADADGADDVWVAAPYESTNAGAVYLLSGSSFSGEGFESAALAHVSGFGVETFGARLAEGPDLDGDGSLDLLVGAPAFDGTGVDGRIVVLSGAVRGEAAASTATLASISAGSAEVTVASYYGSNPLLGFGIADAGDVNGDGLSDLLVGAPYRGATAEGGAYVFSGEISGAVDTSVAMVTHGGAVETSPDGYTVGTYAGWAVAGLGDPTGDGYADYAVSAPGASLDAYLGGAVFFVAGGSTGDLADAAWARVGSTYSNGTMGLGLGAPGDLDGDGSVDVAVGAPTAAPDDASFTGGTWVMFDVGALGGVSTADDSGTLIVSAAGGGFGSALDGSRDLTGDGVDDLLTGLPDLAGTVNYGAGYLFSF